MGKRILLGLHDDSFRRASSMYLAAFGYQVTAVNNLEEMSVKTENSLLHDFFDVYMMDINLGNYGGLTAEPAKVIYSKIESLVNERRTIFIPVSGRPEVVALCQGELGIKAYHSSEISDLLREL